MCKWQKTWLPNITCVCVYYHGKRFYRAQKCRRFAYLSLFLEPHKSFFLFSIAGTLLTVPLLYVLNLLSIFCFWFFNACIFINLYFKPLNFCWECLIINGVTYKFTSTRIFKWDNERMMSKSTIKLSLHNEIRWFKQDQGYFQIIFIWIESTRFIAKPLH